MLRSPRRLPQRFNRPVTPQTKRLVERRLKRKRQFLRQRVQRSVQRLQRRAGSLRKVFLQFATLIVSGTVLLFIGIALFSPVLEIREVRVARSDPRIDQEQIQQAISPLIGEHLFFLSTQQVTDLLEKSVPDLRDASVSKQYPSTLRIRVTLDPIIARLAIDDPDRQETGTGAAATGSGAVEAPKGGDYLTSEGLYVTYFPSQVQSTSGTLLNLRVIDWGVRPEPWKRLVEPQFLDVIRQAESELKSQFGMQIRSREVYLRAREYHLLTARHALWFDLRSPLPEQLQRYRMFLQNVGPDAAKEYVDLRLKDKIVYK